METPKSYADVESREAAFWDKTAVSCSDLHVDAQNLSREDKARLELLGPLPGKRVLDVGCGTGLWATIMAQHGALVWAMDISPESVAATQRRAVLNQVGTQVKAEVMSAYQLLYEENFFDIVHGQDIIHHLEADRFGSEIARVLNAEGHCVFSENSANNTLLMLARNHLCGRFGIPKWSSDDEYPLTRTKLAQFGSFFSATHVYYPEFKFLHYLNAKFFGYRKRSVNWVCATFDGSVHRHLPFLRQYSYRQMIHCARPAAQVSEKRKTQDV